MERMVKNERMMIKNEKGDGENDKRWKGDGKNNKRQKDDGKIIKEQKGDEKNDERKMDKMIIRKMI